MLLFTDPGYNPAAEAFKSFDQEQSSNLLGGLHIDTDEEPRRGASRANSVRFDESALQGHFGHTSRSSSEFFPIRTGSGLGGVSMVERSSSHKSDGRQSSTGHSTRLNSLAFGSRSPALEGATNVGPPPGLFLLGPLPSIIRCWLDKNFSNDALLYAAVCTGSCTSMISSRLAHRFSVLRSSNNSVPRKVSLRVYFPEATIHQSSSRALDLIPQVPAITTEFEVFESSNDTESLQIIIGSDTLRAKSSELSFSQERMTIFDDEHNKLTIPLVRPENPGTFQTLRTVSSSSTTATSGKGNTTQIAERSYPGVRHDIESHEHHAAPSKLSLDTAGIRDEPIQDQLFEEHSKHLSVASLGRANAPSNQGIFDTSSTTRFSDDSTPQETGNGIRSATPTREKEANMSGPWRRESSQTPVSDSTFSSIASNSTYQKPGRGKGMKILKPARSNTFRSMSSGQPLSAAEPTPSRWQDLAARGTVANGTESSGNQSLDSPRRSFSSDTKPSLPGSGGKSRSANPIGGASAFGRLNSGQN